MYIGEDIPQINIIFSTFIRSNIFLWDIFQVNT